jgi:hypothetical protein
VTYAVGIIPVVITIIQSVINFRGSWLEKVSIIIAHKVIKSYEKQYYLPCRIDLVCGRLT